MIYVKNYIKTFADLAKENWVGIVIALASLMLFFVMLVLMSWLIGYWMNALYGTKFELQSCWQGLGAVVTGLGGLMGVAKTCWTVHEIDSKYNSPEGENPLHRFAKGVIEK